MSGSRLGSRRRGRRGRWPPRPRCSRRRRAACSPCGRGSPRRRRDRPTGVPSRRAVCPQPRPEHPFVPTPDRGRVRRSSTWRRPVVPGHRWEERRSSGQPERSARRWPACRRAWRRPRLRLLPRRGTGASSNPLRSNRPTTAGARSARAAPADRQVVLLAPRLFKPVSARRGQFTRTGSPGQG